MKQRWYYPLNVWIKASETIRGATAYKWGQTWWSKTLTHTLTHTHTHTRPYTHTINAHAVPCTTEALISPQTIFYVINSCSDLHNVFVWSTGRLQRPLINMHGNRGLSPGSTRWSHFSLWVVLVMEPLGSESRAIIPKFNKVGTDEAVSSEERIICRLNVSEFSSWIKLIQPIIYLLYFLYSRFREVIH